MAKLDDKSLEALFSLPNVIGVGYGFKEVKGIATSLPSLLVLVQKKLPPEQLLEDQLIPHTIKGQVTDVLEVGQIKALSVYALAGTSRTGMVRPAPPGVSIGHYLITAGTFGAIAYDNLTGQPLILSNNHVLANATNGNDGRAFLDDPVLQPGPIDCKYYGWSDGARYPNYVIGKLSKYVPLAEFPEENIVDCALAKPLRTDYVTAKILGIGRIQGVVTPLPGMAVRKSGRTSGVTYGKIRAVDVVVNVDYGSGRICRFANQILSTRMAVGGDSGSLVLDRNNMAVGLLFAGSDMFTLFNPMETVLAMLNISLKK